MLKQYIKKGAYNTFFYSMSSFISRGFSFFFLPYFLSKLTLEEFGIWEFYQTFFSIGTLILTSATASGLTRYYLFFQDQQDRKRFVVS